MGFNLISGCLSRLSPFSGSRVLLNLRYSIPIIEERGIKQSVEENIDLPKEPKKPLRPYTRFMKQIRPSLVQDNPRLSLGELSKIVSERWRDVEHSTRIELELQYEKDKEAYQQEKLKYLKNLTVEQKSAIEHEKQREKDMKYKKLLKQKAKELEKPKKPLTSYMLFSLSRLKDKGTIPLIEWQKRIGEEWRNLDISQKEKFNKEAKESHERYVIELQKWEEKMVNLGHADLVRTQFLLQKPKQKSKK